MTEVKTNTNIFENAFIGVMNILKEKGHVLFGAIVNNYHGEAMYPMNRAWCSLNSLTLAWYSYHFSIDNDDKEVDAFINKYLHTRGGNEKFRLDFLEENEDEESELKLKDDRYESAFGDLMAILMTNNSPLFDKIRSAASRNTEKTIHDSAHEDDNYEKDTELMKLGYAWKIWCDQNTYQCSVEEFENLQRKIPEEEI